MRNKMQALNSLLNSRLPLLIFALFFAAPPFLSTYFFRQIVVHAYKPQLKSYGHLFSQGTKAEIASDHKWQLVHVVNQQQPERMLFWQEQLEIILKMLPKFSDRVEIKNIAYSPSLSGIQNDWQQYSLEEGSILLLDQQGFAAIGFRYDQYPKLAFKDIKKLLQATNEK